jgi:hypothetical protein
MMMILGHVMFMVLGSLNNWILAKMGEIEACVMSPQEACLGFEHERNEVVELGVLRVCSGSIWTQLTRTIFKSTRWDPGMSYGASMPACS